MKLLPAPQKKKKSKTQFLRHTVLDKKIMSLYSQFLFIMLILILLFCADSHVLLSV